MPYRAWDRDEKLGPVPDGGFKPDDPKVIAWEAAHGHDLRLKCLPEFGCKLAGALSVVARWRLKRWGRRYLTKPTVEQAERAKAVARERGWLTDEGWKWER